METLIEQHGEYGPIQIMETAVAYYQLDDEKVSFGHSKKHFKTFRIQYYRLRMKLNDLIISKSRFDDFYASRHFGQFIIYVSFLVSTNHRLVLLYSDFLDVGNETNIKSSIRRAFGRTERWTNTDSRA